MGRRRSFVRHIKRAGRRGGISLNRLVGSTLGMGLALAATGAWAQTPAPPPQDGKDDVSLPGVDVRGQRDQYKIEEPSLYKLPDPIKDTPQSITVLPEQILEQRSLFTLREALRTVPGIALAAGEGGGRQGDNLTLRGFSAGTDIFIDGVRDLGQYARDTFNLESIEVLKGPSAVLFGRGATGGVINQVSKAPRLTPFSELTGTVGSGPQGRVAVDLNQPFGPSAALRLNLMGFKGETPGRDYIEQERLGVAPSFGIGLNGPTRFIASFYYLSDDNMPDYGLPYVFGKPPDVDRENFYGFPGRDYEHDDVHIGTLRFEHDFNENLRLRNTLRLALIKRGSIVSPPRIVGTPTPGTPLSQILVSRSGAQRDQTDTSITNSTDVVFKFNTWRLKHTLVAGVEAGHETSDVTRHAFTGIPTTALDDPDNFPSLAGMGRAKNFDGSSSATSVGVYAVDEVSLTEQWKIMGGLRYDLFDADFRNRVAAQKLSRTDEALNPRAALVFLPTKIQTYYFSYGTSFNPSAEALTLSLNNAGTEPEKNESFELGAKFDFLNGALGLRGAVFQINKTNARTNDPVLGVQVTDGRQRVRGVELELVGQILRGWNVFLGYTYLDSRVTESNDVASGIPVEGKRVQNVPEHSASLWTTYDITSRWQVGGGATFVDRRYANNVNTNAAPAFVTGDALIAFRPIKPLELRFNVLNLSNATYFDSTHPAHVIPGASRTFLLTGTWRF
ncbi:MAG: TonB-dependent siderophore receptor [Candidatus Rokuibacteriota bacterium]